MVVNANPRDPIAWRVDCSGVASTGKRQKDHRALSQVILVKQRSREFLAGCAGLARFEFNVCLRALRGISTSIRGKSAIHESRDEPTLAMFSDNRCETSGDVWSGRIVGRDASAEKPVLAARVSVTTGWWQLFAWKATVV